ncbi:hypothetical protein CONPUDRAFT_37871, partial [Coniophora puteana RWD-64-598 SS2]
LNEVLHIPEATRNLLSVSKLDQTGGRAIYGDQKVRLVDNIGEILATGRLINNLYYIKGRPVLKGEKSYFVEPIAHTWEQWH